MIAVKHLHVTHFDRMLCAFQVQYSDDSNTHFIPLSSLYCHGALALYRTNEGRSTLLKNYHQKDLWTLL